MKKANELMIVCVFPYFDNVDICDADEGGRPDGRHKGPRI